MPELLSVTLDISCKDELEACLFAEEAKDASEEVRLGTSKLT